jgi:preprotein translocase SecE subunit
VAKDNKEVADKTNRPRRRKQPETIREKAKKESAKKASPKKRDKVKKIAAKPVKKVIQYSKLEYHPIKVPEKKGFKFLNKRVRFIPNFVKSSWVELRQVVWPTKGEAAQKTLAVIMFALVFAAFVQLLDWAFSRIVKEIILR